MLADAIAFAAEAHRLQKDKQGVPYILHPFRVVEALRQERWPETYQVVAILHDVVEDTETTLEEIYGKFGSIVGDAIDAISRRKDEYTGRSSEDYKDYIRRCCDNSIARVVKRFDVYDNADPRRYINGSLVERYVWTLEYLQGLDHLDINRAEHGVFS